jgi:hypothetical protein
MARKPKQAPVANQGESAILHDIRQALGNEPDLVLYRNQVGGFTDPDTGRVVKFGLGEGSSDLVGMLRMRVVLYGDYEDDAIWFARWFVLEVKSPKGKTAKRRREMQRLFLELVRKMGGFGCKARSVSEARAALDRARKGESE